MRLVIILFAIVVGFLLLRSLLAPLVNAVAALIAPSPQPPQAAAGPKPAGELKKDPVCGAFISPELAITKKIKGEVVHFCSEKCRDEYARTA